MYSYKACPLFIYLFIPPLDLDFKEINISSEVERWRKESFIHLNRNMTDNIPSISRKKASKITHTNNRPFTQSCTRSFGPNVCYYSKVCCWTLRHNLLLLLLFNATAQFGLKLPHCWSFWINLTHTNTHTHTRQYSTERVISSSHRPPPTQHTTNTSDPHPCPQRDSILPSQQWCGSRPTH